MTKFLLSISLFTAWRHEWTLVAAKPILIIMRKISSLMWIRSLQGLKNVGGFDPRYIWQFILLYYIGNLSIEVLCYGLSTQT